MGSARGGATILVGSLTDETGSIALALPGSVLDVGGQDGSVDVEVDVAAAAPPASLPDLDTRAISGAALAGDLDTAGELGAALAGSLADVAPGLLVVSRMAPMR